MPAGRAKENAASGNAGIGKTSSETKETSPDMRITFQSGETRPCVPCGRLAVFEHPPLCRGGDDWPRLGWWSAKTIKEVMARENDAVGVRSSSQRAVESP